MKVLKVAFIIFCLLILQRIAVAQTVSDYLILNNIGTYAISKPQSVFLGEPPIGGPQMNDDSGVLSGTDHFPDHTDKTYKVRYIGANDNPSPKVQVTQHTGGDSDRWLLHEVDAEYRTYYGIPGEPYAMRVINGNTIITYGGAGWDYRWLSGNKIINITYEDGMMTKPEPLEVVNAYLAKHPSTLSAITSADLRKADNQKKWIKDEIDRRLWLCDKWNAQFQAGKASQKDLLDNLYDSMEVFLYYREKYYSVAARTDLNALFNYKRNNDLTSIQTKLTEYKTWWAKHKDKSISLK